jgi:predicted transcriptional regulator
VSPEEDVQEAQVRDETRLMPDTRQTPRPVGAFERIRRERGLRQADLAELAGVSRSYIAMCEQGWRPPGARQEAIASALKVSRDQLWPEREAVAAS